MDLDANTSQTSFTEKQSAVVVQQELNLQPAFDDARQVQHMNANGVVETLTCKQISFPDAYSQHVAQYGARIKDNPEADLRLYTALSVYQSSSGDPQIAQQLQKITTTEELEAFFQERNLAAGSVHDNQTVEQQREEEAKKPREDPLEKENMRKLVENAVTEMNRLQMLEKAPDISIKENTIAARVATIRRLQEDGIEVILNNPRPELREALGMPADPEIAQRELLTQDEKNRVALEGGLQTSNTQNPADPQQAEALAQQIEGAAHIHKRATENPNPITRCDAVDGLPHDRWFELKPRDFANFMDQSGFGCQRLDVVAPIAPIVADRFIAESLPEILRAEMYNMHVDALVHPSKLTLYLQGAARSKMVLYSDQKIYLASLLKELGTTNMRPTHAQLVQIEAQQRAELLKKLEEQHIPAAVNEQPLPDEHRGTHSKEGIATLQRAILGEAVEAFNSFLTDAVAAVVPGNAQSTQQFLQALNVAQRTFCISSLRSYELAIMLYFEQYIPTEARHDLMTPFDEACELCTANDVKQQLLNRREWFETFRQKTFLVAENQYQKRIDLSKLCEVDHPDDRVDQSRSWSPTYREMVEFLRFLSLRIGMNELKDTEERAWRWVKKYINDMRASNAN